MNKIVAKRIVATFTSVATVVMMTAGAFMPMAVPVAKAETLPQYQTCSRTDLLNNISASSEIAVDSQGNAWVTNGTDGVAKYSPSGAQLTYVMCSRMYPDRCRGVDTDASDNMYIYAGEQDDRIQKFSPTGTRLASVYFGGYRMTDMTVGADGMVYALQKNTSTGANTIKVYSAALVYSRSINLPGVMMDPAGIGEQIAVNSAGEIFIRDSSYALKKYASDGTYLATASSKAYRMQINPVTGELYTSLPSDQNIYVVYDGNLNEVSRIWTTVADGPQVDEFDQLNGTIYALDEGGNLDIHACSATTTTPTPRPQLCTYTSQWGSYGTGDGQFDTLLAIDRDAEGNIYTGEAGANSSVATGRIQKFGPSGNHLLTIGQGAPGSVLLYDLAVDSLHLEVYRLAYDFSNGGMKVDVFDTSTGALKRSGQVASSRRIAVNGTKGEVYVGTDSGELIVYDTNLNYLRQFSTGMQITVGIEIDSAGNLLIPNAYYMDHSVKVYNPVDGTLLRSDPVDGYFLGLDESGQYVVGHNERNRITYYDSQLNAQTYWGYYGRGDGEFYRVYGVVVVGNNVYAVDYGNHRVQMFTCSGISTPSPTPPPQIICKAVDGKACICHYPDGNPSNTQVIEVSTNAVKAHIKHGDDMFNELTQVCDIPVAASAADGSSSGSLLTLAAAALAAGLGVGLYLRRRA